MTAAMTKAMKMPVKAIENSVDMKTSHNAPRPIPLVAVTFRQVHYAPVVFCRTAEKMNMQGFSGVQAIGTGYMFFATRRVASRALDPRDAGE